MNTMNEMRIFANIGEHQIDFTETTDYPSNYRGFDDNWSLKHFVKNVKIEIIKNEENEMEFDLIGVDCSLANAFRRILISEVPTMAIEKVFVHNNTSLFQDEFLSHRLGLIPIKADPRIFEYKQKDDTKASLQNTIVFNLKVKCTKKKNITKDTKLSEELYENRMIFTKHLVWEPIGTQSETFKDNPIKPVDDDILIAKLAAGQELDLQLHCVKGIGRDHAKFSPVATASYRLLPQIELLSRVEGEETVLFQKCFSKGVIDIIEDSKGRHIAKVVNSRLDSGSRNVFRFPQFKDRVKMTLIKDHFIFRVESTGILPSHQLVIESINIMIRKCRHFLKELREYPKRAKKSK